MNLKLRLKNKATLTAIIAGLNRNETLEKVKTYIEEVAK